MTQIATQNSLELIEDPKAEAVEEIAAKLGLRKVGDIFYTSQECGQSYYSLDFFLFSFINTLN